MGKTWLIAGAGNGIGRAVALAPLRHGDRVVATTRREGSFSMSEGAEDCATATSFDG